VGEFALNYFSCFTPTRNIFLTFIFESNLLAPMH